MSSPQVNRFGREGLKGPSVGVVVLLAFFGCSGTPNAPCFGLQVDHTYAVTVEGLYDAMSMFTFTKEIATDPTAACDPQLQIPDGTKLSMKVLKQIPDNGCAQSYAAIDGVPNVMFTSDFRYDYPYGLGAILAWNQASAAGITRPAG